MQGRGENTGDHNTLGSKNRQTEIKTPGVLAGFDAERVQRDGRERRVECGQVVKGKLPSSQYRAQEQNTA